MKLDESTEMAKRSELTIKNKKQLDVLRDFIKTVELQNQSKIANLKNVITSLTPLYDNSKKYLIIFIRSKYHQNERLFSKTTFEVMDRHAEENVHSNVIAYLLDKKGSGKKLLKAIIEQLPEDSKNTRDILPLIDTCEYKISREKILNGNGERKRIDIFIESRDFFILIENKFNAGFHKIEEEDQTNYYYRKSKEKYPNKKKLFILLDKKGELEVENYDTLDYKAILKAILKVKKDFEDDIVYDEYFYLLRRIIYFIDEINDKNLEQETLSELINIKRGVQNDIG